MDRRIIVEYTGKLESAAQALVSLDSEALVDCYAPEFRLVDAPSGRERTDRDELIAYYKALFSMPDVRFTDVKFFSMGDRAGGEWTWHGRSQESGQPFAIRGASLFRLTSEGIAEELLFYDPRAALA